MLLLRQMQRPLLPLLLPPLLTTAAATTTPEGLFLPLLSLLLVLSLPRELEHRLCLHLIQVRTQLTQLTQLVLMRLWKRLQTQVWVRLRSRCPC